MSRTEPLGIDISRYQFPIDWDKFFAQPVKFVAMRATIGNSYVDPWFASGYDKLRERLPRTAYHVVRPDVDAGLQSVWFVQVVEQAAPKTTNNRISHLPLVLDCELDNGKSPAHVAQVIYDCARYVEDFTGHKPILYSRTSWINPHIGAKQWLNEYDWWLAHYMRGGEMPHSDIPLPPTIDRKRFIIHQTTDRLNGADFGAASKQIDGNRWVSDTPLDFYIAEFRGLTVPKPPPVIPEYTDPEKLALLWNAHEELHA